jgi:hypothetical protein
MGQNTDDNDESNLEPIKNRTPIQKPQKPDTHKSQKPDTHKLD